MKLALLTAAVAAALTMTAPAGAHLFRPGCNSHLSARAELRCARLNRQHALATVAWARQQQKSVRFLDATTAFQLERIVADHRWLYRAMTRRVEEAQARLAAEARRAAAAALPAYHLLWMCIHGGEGAWDDPNSGGNGHYGGLQMHPGWGYGTSYYANNDSQLVQEQSAERAYKASGYSRSWLDGQWGQTIGPCWKYAR